MSHVIFFNIYILHYLYTYDFALSSLNTGSISVRFYFVIYRGMDLKTKQSIKQNPRQQRQQNLKKATN